jgi:hypothetical protein
VSKVHLSATLLLHDEFDAVFHNQKRCTSKEATSEFSEAKVRKKIQTSNNLGTKI